MLEDTLDRIFSIPSAGKNEGLQEPDGEPDCHGRIIRQDPADLKATPVRVFSVNSPDTIFSVNRVPATGAIINNLMK